MWVTRMAGELGADPLMCAFFGGEVGDVLEPLLSALPGELRLVRTAAGSGCGVFDRRQGERRARGGLLELARSLATSSMTWSRSRVPPR